MKKGTPHVQKVERRHIDYSGHAKQYDARRFAGEENAYYEWLRLRALGRALSELPRTAAILDVGCGTGRGIASLSELGFANVIGLDLTESMLRQAQTKAGVSEAGDSRLIRGDAFKLPFADGQFDVVISFNFLHMFQFGLQDELVAEMRRVARHTVVVELESLHKGLWVSRYPEQRRSRTSTKFNSRREVRRLFAPGRFESYRVWGRVLPLIHRWLRRAPSIGMTADAVTRLPVLRWLASRVFVVGTVRRERSRSMSLGSRAAL